MANIFAEYAQPVRSVADYQNDYDRQALLRGQLEGQTRQNALAGLMADQQRMTIADTTRRQNALRVAADAAKLQGMAPGAYADSLVANPDTMDAGVTLQKHLADTGKVTAETSKALAETAAKQAETRHAAAVQLADKIGMIQTPEDLSAYEDAGIQAGVFPPQAKGQALVKAQQLGGIEQWKAAASQAAVPIVDRFKQDAEMARAKLQSDTSIKTTGMNNATSVQTTGMTNATTQRGQTMAAGTAAAGQASVAQTAREGHRIQAAAAGIDPQTGNFIVGPGGKSQFQGLIDEIGSNQISQSTALARVPPGVKAQILEQVRQQYPDYRVEDYAAKNAAFKAYNDPNSKSAASLQAANTALNHLETIKALADAQNNGNLPLFNKIANEWALQTGQAAPKNMRDAALMVGPEISKAVVSTGGGVGERGDFVKALGGDYSPAQIAGTAATMQELLGGRLSEAERSYKRGTGRKDFRSDAYLSPAAQKILADRDARAGGAAPAPAGAALPAKTDSGATVSKW